MTGLHNYLEEEKKKMRPLFKPAVAAVCTAVIAGCGGGGDSPTPAPASSPTPAPAPTPTPTPAPAPTPTPAPAPTPAPPPASVNATNYLNAYWLGLVGVFRMESTSSIVDLMFSAFVEKADQSGTVACSGGGSVNLTKTGATRTMVVPAGVTCVEGGLTLYSGSQVTSPDAVFGGIGTIVLTSGTFNFTNVAFKVSSDPFQATETVNGTLALQLASNGGFSGTGNITFARNGKTDTYSNINVLTTAANSSGQIELVSGAFNLATPRFGSALAMTGNVNQATLTATAPDGSNVTGAEVLPSTNPTSRTYTLRASAGGTAVATQTLSDNDTSVLAALANALN